MPLFGPLHLFYLGLTAAGIWLACLPNSVLDRNLKKQGFRHKLFWTLIIADILWIATTMIYLGYPITANLPLELCDMGLIFALWLLRFSSSSMPKSMPQIALFFCVPAPLLAILFPEVDPPSFLQQISIAKFYFTHIWMVIIALHSVCHNHQLPQWAHVLVAWALLIALSTVMWFINFRLGTNYFFISAPPKSVEWVQRVPYTFYVLGHSVSLLITFLIVWRSTHLLYKLTHKKMTP